MSAEQAAQKAKADASQEARSFSLVLHIQPPKPLRETFLSSPKEEMSALPAWLHVSRPQNLHLRRCEFPSVLDGTYWIKLRDDAVRPPELESLIVSGKEPKSKRFGPAKVQDVAILHPLLKTNYNKWKSWRGVPPAWGMSAFGVPKVDARTYGIPMQPRLKLNAERQLREDQDIAVTSMVEEALVSGYAAVVLPCGSGKSAVAVAVMTHPSLAQHAGEPPPRAAFLTDQIRLMNQFEDDLRGTHGRFGWCPEARVGRIQESYTGAMAAGENTKRRRQFDVDNKDIVIISPRTLAVCNDIPQEVLDTFGTLWYDEGELCASPAMQAVLRKFKCRYRFCATATQRSDGFQCIVHWSLGANVCVMQRYAHITGKYDAARVLMVDGDAWTTIPTFTVPRWQDDKPEIDLHAYHANQSINDKRNAFLCSLVRDVLFVRGVARVMVFTQSVAHIIELETLLNAYLSFCSDALFPLTPALSALDACVCSDAKTQKQKAKIQTNKIVVAIHSDLTPAAQDAAWAAAASPACKVLIGTYKMIGRGYDDNFVDVGIFAMEPTGALPQRFGRLQRPRKDKPLPLIIQLVDRWSLIQSLASKCVAEFEKFGFSIHHVSALDLAALLKQRWTKALHCFAHNLDLLAAGQGLAQILNTAATQAFLNNKPALAIEVVNPLSAPPVKGTSECLFDEAQDL